MTLNVSEAAVAQGTRLLDITRAQRETQTLGSGIGLMYSHMTPPHASVVPEVMILVIIIDPESDLGFLR